MSRRRIAFLLGLIVAMVSLNPAHAGQRDRPVIDSSLGYNIILTDEGTLLRGVSLAWDGGDPYGSLPKVVPTGSQLRRLAEEFGLNTVHLYLEGNSSQNPNEVGVNMADADAFVQATAEAGLYLIITIGCNGENGGIHSLDFARDFWTIYGPRYRHQTHVIYEAHNEPALYTPNQWKIEDWDRQVELYETMRQAAPDTLILLCTFMGFAGDPTFGAEYLAQRGVSWENAGFAHHGYESKDGIENAISIMQSDPAFPPLLCTEFWPGDTEGQGYNGMYESRLNGWMQFQWLGADDEDLHLFRSKITSAGTIWTPDDADARWPASGTPAVPADGAMVGLYQRSAGRFVGVRKSSGNQLRADRLTYTGGLAEDGFIVEHVGGTPLVRLRTPGGDYVRTSGVATPLRALGGTVEDATLFEWIQVPSGDHALRAFSGGGHLVRWDPKSDRLFADADDGRDRASHFVPVSAAHDLPEPLLGEPFHGLPHEVPVRIEAEDYDLGGDGTSYSDTDPSNNGDRYRRLEGVDIEETSDQGGGWNVGWIGSGEWMDYSIMVPGGGPAEYVLEVRVASPGPGARFGMRFAGDATDTIEVPDTGGYQQWTTIATTVSLEPGPQMMRFENRGDTAFNLNWFELSCPPCPADFNGDGRVDGADLPIVLSSWGSCPEGCPADVDRDGDVDGADLSSVLASWGACS